MKLKDISISKTQFYLRKTDTSGKQLQRKFWSEFKRVIEVAETEVGGETHGQHDYRDLDDPPFQRGRIVPILSSPWTKNVYDPITLRRFISRVFLDVFSLQLFACIPHPIEDDELRGVLDGLLLDADKTEGKIAGVYSRGRHENHLEGHFICYWIEFASSQWISKRADSVLRKAFGTDEFKKIEFSYGTIAFRENGETLEFCILVKDVDKCAVLFNDILTEYFLSWAKVKNEEAVLREALIEDDRESLNTVLNEGRHTQRLSLEKLEEANFSLSEKRTLFAEKLLDMEFHLRTLEINISNAQKLVNKGLLAEQKDVLTEMLVKPLELIAEQTKAYIAYYGILLEKGRVAGEKIANDANLKSAIYSRRLSFLFGLFGLIGILGLFPDSFGKIDDTYKAVILFVLIAIFTLFAFKTEIKNRFSK